MTTTYVFEMMRLLVLDINRDNVNVVQKVYTSMKVKAKYCPLIKKFRVLGHQCVLTFTSH